MTGIIYDRDAFLDALNAPIRYKSKNPGATYLERFSGQVAVSGDDDCWLWQGSRDNAGYGQMHVYPHGSICAHKIAYVIDVGAIPAGLYVLHNCPNGDNKLCLNPRHLWVGTAQDNMRDKVAKGQQGPCGRRILTLELVTALRERYANGEKIDPIARDLGIPRVTAWYAATGKTWKHVS